MNEPIVTFSQSIVDDTLEKNIEFHHKAGLQPTITRTVVGHACDWCKNLAGTYNYFEKPDDIYRRHQRCRCVVEYNPKDGTKQNVWNKKVSKVNKSKNSDKNKFGIVDKDTGRRIETSFKPVKINKNLAESLNKRGWIFDWNSTKGQVYQLSLKGSNEILGLISFEKGEGYNYVDLVESSQYNKGIRKYDEVGSNLFAIVAQDSMKNGNDGYVSFTPKSKIRDYYKKILGAKDLPNGNLYLDTEALIKLIKTYFGEE